MSLLKDDNIMLTLNLTNRSDITRGPALILLSPVENINRSAVTHEMLFPELICADVL